MTIESHVLDRVRREIMESGFGCYIERGDFLSSLTFSSSYLYCSETKVTRDLLMTPFEICFWIHEGSGLAFLGLMSGLYYRVSNLEMTADLAIALLEGRYHPRGNAPWSLSEEVLREFSLQKCDMICVLSDDSADSFEEAKALSSALPFNQGEFVARMSPLVTSCKTSSDGFVTLDFGSASALTRFRADGTARGNYLPILFYDDIRETPDQVQLLRSLLRGLDCVIYESQSWGGNKICLDDPYYAIPTSFPRPDEPRNAWPGSRY